MEAIVKELQQGQQDLQKAVAERQQLETQLQESKIVKAEFDLLGDDAKVYKMNAGLVLVPENKPEAAATVEKRLTFIQEQIKAADARLKTLQEALVAKQTKLQQAQAEAQATLDGAAPAQA